MLMKRTWKDERTISKNAKVFSTLLYRDFVVKARNKMNIYISFVIPPVLGLIIGFILRYSRSGEYHLYDNKHLPTFFFLAVLVALFLGLTNSIEEVVKERNVLMRENRIYKSALLYYLSKVLTLLVFSIVQNVIFLLVSYAVIGLRELFFSHLWILTLLSLTAISIGLLISSIPRMSSKAANNFIPLVLIPQIILGGAMIQYKEMNEQVVFDKSNPIPEICQIIPSRWGFEAMVMNQAQRNSFHQAYRVMDDSLDIFRKTVPRDRLISLLSSQSGKSIEEATSIADEMENSLTVRRDMHIDRFKLAYGNAMVEQTAQLSLDDKDGVDGRGYSIISPLFSKTKVIPFVKAEVSTVFYNALILILMSVVLMLAGILLLRWTVFNT